MLRTSVVITAFNLEAFIADAIESALGQTRKPDEIIVVDDASRDRTLEILRRYEGRVRVVALPENIGALRAALTGLSVASGEVIAFLDGDDIWEPKKLELCVDLFERDPEMMLASHQHMRVDARGNALRVVDETSRNVSRITARFVGDDLSTELKRSVLEKRGYWLGSAYLFRRNLLDLEEFSRWVATLEHAADVYLDLVIAPFLILSNPSKRVGIVDEVLFRYRIHGNNSCNDFRDVERALRSVRRGHRTTQAADALNLRFLERSPLARSGHAAHQRALRFYEFLDALYRNRRMKATGLFVSLVWSKYFSPRSFMKELARLAIVWIGGVELFLRLKDRR